MTHHRSLWAALLLLAAVLAGVAPTGQSQAGTSWFGPTGVDEGWHMRIGLTVRNPFPSTMVGAPVAAELDLGAALLEAGWPGLDAGDGRVITGFRLDESSIRVVRDTGGDAEEVAGLVIPGLLGRQDATDAARAYDASSNPVVTVFFRIAQPLAPGAEARYHVYFDSAANGPKPAPDHQGPEAGALEGLHWATAGTRLYGLVPSTSGAANQVVVIALSDNTQVSVARLQAGQFKTDGVSLDPGPSLQAGGTLTATLGVGANPVFRVTASAPVVAMVAPVGFVPSADGGLVGKDFRFRTPRDGPGDGERGLYFINVGTDAATVRLTRAGAAPTFYTIPASPGLPYGGSNVECDPVGPWRPVDLDRAYRAEVIDGGPILVQLQPRVQQQLPSLDGAPTGTSFLAATQWSGPSCTQGNGQPFLVAAEGAGVTIAVRSLEDPVQLFPSGSPGNPTPPGFAVPAPPAWSDGLALDPADARGRDRPLSFEANGPVLVLAGGAPQQGQPSPLAGPLGGAGAGRSFAAPAPVLVVALYPETHLEAQVQYATGSAVRTAVLGAEGVLSLGDDPDLGRLLSLRFTTDRPVAAYPTKALPGFLSGVPGFLDSTPQAAADYRGRLVEIRSASGDDPVAVTVRAGETSAVSLVVANLGRGVGPDGGQLESVNIEVSGAPAGWTVAPDRPSLTLPAGQEDFVRLLITPPAGADASAPPATLSIKAISADNPSVRDELTAIAFVKTSFGVALWFVTPESGPKTAPQSVPPGGVADYVVYAKNIGSQDDVILFKATTQGAPDAATLLDAQRKPVVALPFKPQQLRKFNLTVEAGGLQDGLLVTSLEARSQGANGAFDRLTAVTRVRAAADLQLTVLEPLRLVADGEESLFQAVLANPGQSASDVRFALLSDVPFGWAQPKLFLEDPFTHRRLATDRLTLDPGGRQVFYINVTPAAGAPAGALAGLRLVATPGSGAPVDAAMTGVVAARHRIVIEPEADPVPAMPGQAAAISVTLRNQGNLAEVLHLEAADLPAGWDVKANDTALPTNGTATIRLSVHPVAGALPGLYLLGLRWATKDGQAVNFTLNVSVQASIGTAADGSQALLAQPGQRLPVSVQVANAGNQPAAVRLAAAAGEPWTLEFAGPVGLAPGATTTVTAMWVVPRTAADGPSLHRAVLTMSGADGAVGVQAVRDFTIDVGRPNLRLEAASAAGGAAGGLVQAVVHNDGNRPAFLVDVVLEAPGTSAPLANQTLQRIEAGKSAVVLLAVPGRVPDGATLRVDPDDRVVETVEEDNASLIEDGAGRPAPASAALLCLLGLALALAALARRR